MDGSGNISVGGLMDVNDNGNDTNICGASPCNVTGSYSYNKNTGLGQMTLKSGVTMNFDFFISSGTANKTNPLTLYAISTDPSANPAVSGTMVLQDSTLNPFSQGSLKGTSVSALTGTGSNGTNTNVSLILGQTDGSGNFAGLFDQNNAGTVLSTIQFPPTVGTNNYTYTASGTNGRYVFNLLGNPGANPVVAPLPFIFYASGANRGFLLDQSSSSVMTGTMDPQGKGGGVISGSTYPGTYAAATTSSGDSAASSIAANLLLTSPGNGVFNVSGTQYPGTKTVTGTYAVNPSSGNLGLGTITLTAPSAQNYVIYAVDTSACTNQSPVCAVLDFFMIDEDTANKNAAIVFAQQ